VTGVSALAQVVKIASKVLPPEALKWGLGRGDCVLFGSGMAIVDDAGRGQTPRDRARAAARDELV
jgi:hypothetical protein